MALPQGPHLSWEEYLAAEETAGIRHELVGGVAFAMTGGTQRHSLLTGAIYRAVSASALAGGCRPHIQVMKLRLSDATSYYPDVMASRGTTARTPGRSPEASCGGHSRLPERGPGPLALTAIAFCAFVAP